MIQLSIIIAYLIFTITIGLLSKRTSNANAYEGFKLSLLMCVAIGAGEWTGGTSTTGVSEYGYLYGLSGAWYTVANGIGICFLALFFARLFRSLNTSTVPEIIGRYLGKKSRIISSVLLIIVLMIVGVSQMISIGTLGEILLKLNPALSICVLGLGVLIYTCVGGMNAIGVTNILHMIVMYVGVLTALLLCVLSFGNLNTVLHSSYFSPVSIGYEKVFSWIIASVLGACTAQAGLQPILKAKDEKTAVRASCFIALTVAPFGILTALLGMYAKANYPSLTNAKLALPMLLMDMNPYVSGFVMAAILAAVLSTASPIFLSCGTLITRDLYGELKYDADDKQLLTVSRISTLVVGIICIVLSVILSGTTTILDIVYFAYSLRGSLFVVLLLGIFWKKMTQKAAVYAMLSTAIVGFAWVGYKKLYENYPITYITETYISIFTAIAVGISCGAVMYRNKNIHLKDYKMRKTVVEYVAEYSKSIPNKIAVITAENSITYKDLFQRACDYAEYLKEYGIKKGNVVVLKASQTIDYAIQYLGIHLAGGIVTSLERNISDKGMVEIAKQIKANVIITDNTLMSDLYSALYIPVTSPPPPRQWQQKFIFQ